MSSFKKDHAINTIMVIIGLTLLTKLIGFVRDAVMGSVFGTSLESDAYLIALNITTIIFLSIGTGIATSIIPISVRLEKNKEKDMVLSSIFNSVFLISGIIAITFFIFTPQVLHVFANGFEGEKLALTVKLTRIMIPTVFFITYAYLYTGLLQAHEYFVLPAITSVPYNMIAIFYLIACVKGYGIIGLAVVTTIGWLFQMVIQVTKVHKVAGFKYSPKIQFKNEYVQEFLIGIIYVSAITATQQITYLTDNTMASHFGDGKVTALYYSHMIFIAIATTVVYGITSVMFPKFNRRYSELDKSKFFTAIDNVIKGIILLLAPVSVGLVLISKNAISLLLMRGEFTFEDVKMTAALFIGYVSYMIAFGIWDVLNKAFYTMGNKRIPMVVSIIIIGLNFILNFICVKRFGLVGITIATAVAFYIGIGVSLFLFMKNEGKLDFIGMMVVSLKTILSVCIMAVAIISANHFANPFLSMNGVTSRVRIITMDIVIGIVIYIFMLFILKEKNIIEVMHSYKRRKQAKN